jgi:hypothetical protein
MSTWGWGPRVLPLGGAAGGGLLFDGAPFGVRRGVRLNLPHGGVVEEALAALGAHRGPHYARKVRRNNGIDTIWMPW